MQIVIFLGLLVILFFSVIFHEVCHGLAALRNGDETAKIMGRITFNPLPHIDPVGTIILPLLLLLISRVSGGQPFVLGWAKPVPVNSYRFHNYRRGMLEVGAAGPLANIILGLFFAFLFRMTTGTNPSGTIILLYYGIFINFLLAFFNLIPIPPLDGSRIVSSLLPYEMQQRYHQIERYGILIIFGLLFFGAFDRLLPLIERLVQLAIGTSVFR